MQQKKQKVIIKIYQMQVNKNNRFFIKKLLIILYNLILL